MSEDWDSSAEAWMAHVDKDVSRTYLLDGSMLAEVGDVSGLRVGDIGCGEGRFARMLAERGAQVVGLDPTLKLLRHAAQKGAGPHYLRGSGEQLPFRSDVFDILVSYVVMVDIPDYRRAIVESARVLKPGGRFVIANLNSFITTRPVAWEKDDEGRKAYVRVDDYLAERSMWVSWCGIEIVNWHRPQSAYFDALLSAGLVLKRYLEPQPTPQQLDEEPRLEGSERVPYFHVMVWEKP